MSCGVALAVSLLLSDPTVATPATETAIESLVPASVASEPLFAGLVATSGELEAVVEAWIAAGRADQSDFWKGAEFTAFKTRASDLAARDMQGHIVLKERGQDGDLKCILRGIAEDMPTKIEAVERASSPADRRIALDELAYLLNDNAEVITAPPAPEV